MSESRDFYPRLTRRDLFRLGALGVAGFELAPTLAPPRLRAAGRATPRGSVDSVILLNLRGGPSQMDTFDAKAGAWTDEEFGIAQARQGFLWPHGLLPKLGERLDRLCLLRSMEAWDTVHSRAQHYLQTGHQSSPARNEEMPSLGAIVAYETESRRRETDFLPPYVSMN
jgi:hypothetical protein